MKNIDALFDAHNTFATLLQQFTREELQEIYDETRDERVLVMIEVHDALYS
jgi:hypothetical protein